MNLFRLTALAWLAGGIARPLMFVTGAFGIRDAAGVSLPAVLLGGAVGVAVGAFLWLRPGRGSAIAGVLFGFYAVTALTFIPLVGTPGWMIVLVTLGLLAFGLSAACLWRTRRGDAAVA